MTQLTLMESSFSCFLYCFIFFPSLLLYFFPDKKGYISAADALFPAAHCIQEGRHLGDNVPSPVEKEAPMGFFRFFQGLPEVCYDSCPSFTTLESSWAQAPVQEGWAQILWESQYSACVLRENNSMCHKTWDFMIFTILEGLQQNHEWQRATLGPAIFSIKQLLSNGWRYWCCWFDPDTSHSS